MAVTSSAHKTTHMHRMHSVITGFELLQDRKKLIHAVSDLEYNTRYVVKKSQYTLSAYRSWLSACFYAGALYFWVTLNNKKVPSNTTYKHSASVHARMLVYNSCYQMKRRQWDMYDLISADIKILSWVYGLHVLRRAPIPLNCNCLLSIRGFISATCTFYFFISHIQALTGLLVYLVLRCREDSMHNSIKNTYYRVDI